MELIRHCYSLGYPVQEFVLRRNRERQSFGTSGRLITSRAESSSALEMGIMRSDVLNGSIALTQYGEHNRYVQWKWRTHM